MELPKILFHVTSKEFLPSIRKEGLIPNKNKQWDCSKNFVYMGLENIARTYGGCRVKSNDKVLLKIKTTLLDATKINKDENVYGPEREQSFQYDGIVPPKAITKARKKKEAEKLYEKQICNF